MSRRKHVRVAVGGRQVVVPPEALSWQFVRSSGPGGQHVNRTSSKAVLRFNAVQSPCLPDDVRRRLVDREAARLTAQGDLVISSQRHRDQAQNVADCLDKLTTILERALVKPAVRRATRTPRSAIAERLDAKKRRSRTKRLRRRPED